MSWSLSFTGRPSICKDSYHRVALSIPIEDLSDEIDSANFIFTCMELAKLYFLHVAVTCTAKVDSLYLGKMKNSIQCLVNLERQLTIEQHPSRSEYDPRHRRLFISLQLPHTSNVVELVDSIAESAPEFYFNLLLLDVCGDRASALDSILSARQHLLDAERAAETALGLGAVAGAEELHWLLDRIPRDALEFVHLGIAQLPDLRLRCAEMVHLFSTNVMIDLGSDALDDTIHREGSTYHQLSQKYQISPDTFLVKALLQMGFVVTIPFKKSDDGGDYLSKNICRTVHPFVHRKTYVSSVRVISLRIAAEDMDVLKEESEAAELLADEEWKPHAQGRAALRELSFTADYIS